MTNVFGRKDLVEAMGGRPPSGPNELEQLREENTRLRGEIEKMVSAQGPIGTVVRLVKDGRALVSLGSGQFNMVSREGFALEPGDSIRFGRTSDGMKVLELLSSAPGNGRVVNVEKVHDDLIEYASAGDRRASRIGRFKKIRPGDSVLLDPLGEIVVRVLERHKSKSHSTVTGVSWEDIGGLEDVKLLLREAIEDPHNFHDLYKSMGQNPPKGMVLEGPAGVGKTLLAKACWTSLASMHGKSVSDSGYIYCKGPELVNKFYGESEAAVRLLFTTARQHFEDHHYPALIFLDEADGLLSRRGSMRNEGMEKTIVPQFLAEMDGLDEMCAFVLVATNRMDILDPALLREGRLDSKVTIPRPDKEASRRIFQVHLKKRPCNVDELAERGTSIIFSDGQVHRVLRLEDGTKHDFHLREVVSGAMLAGLVRRAAQIALRRAKLGGKPWILSQDMDVASPMLLREERLIGQDVEIGRYAQARELRVVRVEMPEL